LLPVDECGERDAVADRAPADAPASRVKQRLDRRTATPAMDVHARKPRISRSKRLPAGHVREGEFPDTNVRPPSAAAPRYTLRELMEFMGHSSLQATDRYVKLLPRPDEADPAERLNAYLRRRATR
jgi:hypothetical protein